MRGWSRLDSYYRIDPDDITNYTMEQVNRALFDFKDMALKAMAQQSLNFQEWQKSTQEAMDREQNRRAMDVMEDEDGHWLIQNPLEDGTIRYQQIRHLQWNDMNGVARARQIVDEINLPQHMMQANDNGMGWDNGDDYYKKGPGMDDELDQTQYHDGRPWHPHAFQRTKNQRFFVGVRVRNNIF